MANKSSHLVRMALAALLVLPVTVLCQVTADMTASKVVLEDHKEVLASAKQAKPGDVIEYRVVYRNRDKAAARNVMATLPVPQGMEYLPRTASPVQVMASTNGSDFASVPLKRQVKKADGSVQEQEVPYSEYRFLRWNLGELPGGSSKSVSARMRIVTTPVATPAAAKQ